MGSSKTMHITFSCGHTASKAVCPQENLTEKEAYASRLAHGLCDDCHAKKTFKDAQLESSAMGLPDLCGSEAQVRWGTTSRLKMIKNANYTCDAKVQEFKSEQRGKAQKTAIETMDKVYVFTNLYRSAHWWIDNRQMSAYEFIVFAINVVDADNTATADCQEGKAVLDEATVYPAKTVSNNICSIRIIKDAALLLSDKENAIIEIARAMQMKWDSEIRAWTLAISPTTGTVEDRVAELGNKLLCAGYPICIIDPDVRNMAIKGKFESRHPRWVVADGANAVKIKWQGRDDALYTSAKSLPYAKYNGSGVVVKAQYFTEIDDFMCRLDFKCTPNAQKVLDTSRIKFTTANRVDPVALQETLYPGTAAIATIDTILDDLRDD